MINSRNTRRLVMTSRIIACMAAKPTYTPCPLHNRNYITLDPIDAMFEPLDLRLFRAQSFHRIDGGGSVSGKIAGE